MRSRKSRSFGNTRKSLWAEQSHASKRSESFGPLAEKKIKANLNYTVLNVKIGLKRKGGGFHGFGGGWSQQKQAESPIFRHNIFLTG